jgi:hypothetical protein
VKSWAGEQPRTQTQQGQAEWYEQLVDILAERQISSNDRWDKVDDPEQNRHCRNHQDKVQPTRGFGVLG